MARLGRLKRPAGMGRRRKRLPLPERRGPLVGGGGRDEEQNQVAVWGQAVGGDMGLARRLMGIVGEPGYGMGTLPELVAIDWLRRRGHGYVFQPGRVLLEASPPDILVLHGAGRAMAWQIHGNYWHMQPETRRRDKATTLLLPGQMILGREIVWVVEIWESRILDRNRREAAFAAAMGGVEQGP